MTSSNIRKNNNEDWNTTKVLVNVLESTNRLYSDSFSSPYYSGYSVKKSTRNCRFVYKRKRFGVKWWKQQADSTITDTDNINKTTASPVKHKQLVNIQQEVNTISDLIDLCVKYPLSDDILYNINMKALHDIKKPLEQMNNMIGLNEIKSNLVDQVIYYVQELHVSSSSRASGDFMHTVIYGPPGTGKTEIAKIIGNIFSRIGVLKNKVFKKVTRDDLIAGYLGQTAIKTKDIIKECIGGVLFIDEVYSLGNAENKDSFSKECIDTLCEALSDHKGELMCIVAGYKEEIKECFFKVNDGLESRFPWQYNIIEYSADELLKIFHMKVREIGWSLDHEIDDTWFHHNLESFKYYGRDMETLLSKVKIAHSKRVFCLPNNRKTIITENDINEGFKNFIRSDNVLTRSEKTSLSKAIHNSMYV